jgi:hypothetical protein
MRSGVLLYIRRHNMFKLRNGSFCSWNFFALTHESTLYILCTGVLLNINGGVVMHSLPNRKLRGRLEFNHMLVVSRGLVSGSSGTGELQFLSRRPSIGFGRRFAVVHMCKLSRGPVCFFNGLSNVHNLRGRHVQSHDGRIQVIS